MGGDLFTVTTGAASFVSIRIHVCGGLIHYCRAWKSHDKEIEEALERLTDLELSLKIMSELLSSMECIDDTLSIQDARQKIYSCSAAMNRLHWILIEIESISQPAGILDKLHNTRLRSTFFFSRDKIQGLKSSVTESQNSLSNAIQLLSLHLLIKQNVSFKISVMDNNDRIVGLQDSIEQAVVKRLDMHGHRLNLLQEERNKASSGHTHDIQQLRSEISALQLGIISRPSLLQSVHQEDQRLQSQDGNPQRRRYLHCTCRSSSTYKILYDSVWPQFKAATFVRHSLNHRDCPLSEDTNEMTQKGLRISFSSWLLRGAIQVAISMTRGSGEFSISPVLAFIPTVASNSAAFKVMSDILILNKSAMEMRKVFSSSKQKLLRLFQEGKASSRDKNEEECTILHKACLLWKELCSISSPPVNDKCVEIYFQFLRDIHEMKVPLNTVNTRGLTPLGVLSHYTMHSISPTFVEKEPSFLLRSHMVELGAEYPLYTREMMKGEAALPLATFGKFCSRNPEILEAAGSNIISQSISARSLPRLKEAIRRDPESVNQPNIFGQTPLHLSIGWSEAIRLLLDAGAATDANDIKGLTPVFYAAEQACLQSIQILGDAGCVLHYESNTSLLDFVVRLDECEGLHEVITQKKAGAVFNCVVKLVAERRQELAALASNVLDGKDYARLHLTIQNILDSKAPLAISMLQLKINVPESLFSSTKSSVYHMPGLRSWQAQSLWSAGFRDINELDSLGRPPLMICPCAGPDGLRIGREDQPRRKDFIEWLLLKGAQLHRRQGHAFRCRNTRDEPSPSLEDCMTDRCSATTVLHYLAALWGAEFYKNMYPRWPEIDDGERNWSRNFTLRDKLSDPFSDSCSCACKSFTMIRKPSREHSNLRYIFRWRFVRRITQSTAHLLDVRLPNLAWLRREIFRYNTFERLRLRHTCCILDFIPHPNGRKVSRSNYSEYFIAEIDDDEQREIVEEQAEQIERLEVLLLEFNKKYEELDISLMEFMGGYWKNRMKQISRERFPVDQAQLARTGVILRRNSSCSSSSSCKSQYEDDDDDYHGDDDDEDGDDDDFNELHDDGRDGLMGAVNQC